jgi:hypothetical protein
MMASLGVAPYVVERVLNHITGSTAESITPLARIYNRHRYIEEMRGALMKLENELLRLGRTNGAGAVTLGDTRIEPGQNFAFDPADTTGSERDSFRKTAGFLEPIDVARGVEHEVAKLFL